ncbi:MAG: TRAM domain-containing protein, partial [Pseudomonadota bacterium]|nr:TRAM domain-containing protein [Pseudomonadota bacterium]
MRSNKRGRSLPREPQVFEIEKLSHEGRGLTRHEGQIVFVEGALPGETVRAEFTSRRGSYAEARTLEVLKPAAERTLPPCPHFSACGGCSLQHYASESQLAFKEAVLHERLEHAAGVADYEKLPAITGADRAYRRKARLAVRYVAKKGRVLVGFREQHSNFITDMDSCAVLEPEVAQLLPLLPELIGRLHCREQLPQVEVAIGDAQPGAN